jgi:hypothetical protein
MILVVGGHSRHVGKTSVIVALIRAIPEARWTAVKITPHSHVPEAVFEETDPAADRDTARYLAAGAARALLVRAEEAPPLSCFVPASSNVAIESTSAIGRVAADLALLVVDPSIGDFKPAFSSALAGVDALVVVDRGCDFPAAGRRFTVRPPDYTSAELIEYVRERITPPGTR